VLILASTAIDFVSAQKIEESQSRNQKRLWLGLSLLSNLGILGFFKYANFFAGSIQGVLGQEFSPVHSFLLPVGISFYTFQTLSYSIDVYKGEMKAYRHLGRFALYVSFFPQLVAGPIERASRLIPQFEKQVSLDLTRISSGLRLMLWGMFKKVVIADRLALVVDQVYNNPGDQSSLSFLLATYFFAFQIYCDFSGYSDIAIGAARVLGYDLMRNFNVPYMAKNIREFWSKWHVSLSTWFRDYVYIPMGGNRSGFLKWILAILVTFLVSGLWHGANWTFVVWGALHGLYLLGERFLGKSRLASLSWKPLNIFVTFHLVLLAWVFFRADSVQLAVGILSQIAGQLPQDIAGYLGGQNVFSGLGDIAPETYISLVLGLIAFYLVDFAKDLSFIRLRFEQSPSLRLASYFGLFYGIIFLGYFGETQFIYFQF
jgi:D-alanyl-lipoteichoic acid acyltransferase DltB (MBOAT superfamily)